MKFLLATGRVARSTRFRAEGTDQKLRTSVGGSYEVGAPRALMERR